MKSVQVVYQKIKSGDLNLNTINIHQRYENQLSLLHQAAIEGDIKLIQLLLNKSVYIDCTDVLGQTPLHVATIYNQISAVQYLINSGANINAKSKQGLTPICFCVEKDSPIDHHLLALLLEHGANPNISLNQKNVTLLHLTAALPDQNKSNKYSQLLIEYGADPNQKISLPSVEYKTITASGIAKTMDNHWLYQYLIDAEERFTEDQHEKISCTNPFHLTC